MKKAALIAAALAMVLSLAACGNRDNNTTSNTPNGSSVTTPNGSGSINDNNYGNTNGTVNGAGTGTGNSNTGTGTVTGNGAGTGAGTGTVTGTGTGTGTGAQSRSRVGNDLRRAADNVGDAVTGMVDDGRDALTRTTSASTFERMLDNARVHDTDGVLTDGENSRW